MSEYLSESIPIKPMAKDMRPHVCDWQVITTLKHDRLDREGLYTVRYLECPHCHKTKIESDEHEEDKS